MSSTPTNATLPTAGPSFLVHLAVLVAVALMLPARKLIAAYKNR